MIGSDVAVTFGVGCGMGMCRNFHGLQAIWYGCTLGLVSAKQARDGLDQYFPKRPATLVRQHTA